MAFRQIRWIDAPRWRQDVQLDGAVYTLAAVWNTRMDAWTLDIESSDGAVLARGIRLVLGWPLLRGIDYDDRLPPGEFMVVDPTGRAIEDPKRDSFTDGGYQLLYQEANDE